MNRTKEANTIYMRTWRENNRLKIREYQKEYNRQWRKENGFHNEVEWKINNPQKVKAQYKAQYAIRIGKLRRKPCEVCRDENVQAHHDNYKKPLEVRWLCPLCHRNEHLGNVKFKKNPKKYYIIKDGIRLTPKQKEEQKELLEKYFGI